MRIVWRIWSGIAIILAGYVLTVVIGAYLSHVFTVRLDQVSNQVIPATLSMYELRSTYARAVALYEAAVVEGEPAHLAKSEPLIEEVVGGLRRLMGQTWMSSERSTQLGATAQRIGASHHRAMAIYQRLARGEQNPELQAESKALNGQIKVDSGDLQRSLDGIHDDLVGVLGDAASGAREQRTISIIVMIAVLVVSAVLVTVIIRRSVTVPLHTLALHLEGIAAGNGDLTRRIPIRAGRGGALPGDELSHLADIFNRFLDNLQRLIRKVGETTERVAGASGDLDQLSKRVSSNAASARGNAQHSAEATGQITEDMREVGTSVEQMVSSIREISTSAQTAARVASDAVGEARDAGATIDRLNTSTASIVEVLRMIESIASQTNLLALNATIEAARAGDSGRGFAVVANEVKELARQTAGATTDIQGRISAIRADSTRASEAISRINQVIDQIKETSVLIAGAVEEQTATTQQMAQVVNGVVAKASAISSGVEAMTTAVDSTAECARQSETAGRDLAGAAKDLTGLVGAFRC
jgi:methyl-accepting chemotaxis protein